jgi:hypothetical protein
MMRFVLFSDYFQHKIKTMSLKNAAILLFACSIVGMAGDLLTYVPHIVEMGLDLQGAVFVLVSLLMNVALLLVAMAFKSGDPLPENRRKAGIFLSVVAGCLTAYHLWQLGERLFYGGFILDFFLWMFFLLFYTVTTLVLGIAILSANPVRMRIAGLFACFGAGAWMLRLLYSLYPSIPYLLESDSDPLDMLTMVMDYALPVGIFFFGLALYRTPVSGLRNDSVIDEL